MLQSHAARNVVTDENVMLQHDPMQPDFYNNGVIKYPWAHHAYFMRPSAFYHPSDTLEIHLVGGMDDVGRRFKANEIFVPEVLIRALGARPVRLCSGDREAARRGEPGDAVAVVRPSASQPKRHLRIYLQRAEDYEEEVRRMREVLNLLRSTPGPDRFSFFVPNPQGMVQLDFPNFTTSYSEIEEPLAELVEAWGSLDVD